MKRKLERELHTTEKADKFLLPAISIVTYGALAISVWDLIVLQHGQPSIEWLNIIGIVLFVSA